MEEKVSIWDHPAIYFVTRMLMLLGMVLFFGGIGYSISVYTSKMLFGVDFISSPELINDYTNPAVVNALKYIQAITAIAIFIIPAWVFCRAIEKNPVDYLKLNRKTSVAEIVLPVFILIAITPFISWLIYINQKMQLPASMAHLESQLKFAEQAADQITKAFLNVDSIGGLISNLIVMALIAAIGEEFLFRGALQNFIRNVSGNRHFAVIFVAVLFSAIHGQFYGFLPRFILGLVLGYAYLFTGNLWVSIIIHFTNNAFAVVFSYKPVADRLPAAFQQDYTFEAWYINAGSALLAISLLYLLKTSTRKRVWYNGE